MSRTSVIFRDEFGNLSARHFDGTQTQTINFHTPEQLWNFCTLDISYDRRSYARPPARNEEEERAAIAAFKPLPKPEPPSEDAILALVAKVDLTSVISTRSPRQALRSGCPPKTGPKPKSRKRRKKR